MKGRGLRVPGRIATIFRSLSNVVPSHLLDAKLFNFSDLAITGVPDPEGDRAFDAAEFAAEFPIHTPIHTTQPINFTLKDER